MPYVAIMSLKKKKNVIVLTICMISCFIMYQMYFFLTLSSETRNINRIIPVIGHENSKGLHIRSEADRFINDNGVIHGVYFKSVSLYKPDVGEFKCLHSDRKIPYEQVNDDYCDCEDGTDEPSTRACVNGTFYCATQYHGKMGLINKISSSKVNDGICDCCDGSDEWLQEPNTKLLSQAHSNHRRFVSKCENLC
ncbi:uncharacterized protein LOC128672592 [Plodia interpunctella]|uniref:uncharacterized protein LOC128672592 n=1 Tax=Plodia interpunctella TaxID=58824 RepID=UPI00236847B6|nr:uncharacterized protein LOC128672592 [Plodia interpunctella]